MAARSRNKGKRGELELRDVLTAHGYEARRGGQQSEGGSADRPDVEHNMPGIHIEVKRVEAYGIVNRTMAQAAKDAGDKIPTMWARSNRAEWLVTMRADDWFKMFIDHQFALIGK